MDAGSRSSHTGTGKCLKTASVCCFLHPSRLLRPSLHTDVVLFFSQECVTHPHPHPRPPAMLHPCPWTVIGSLWRLHQSGGDESVQSPVFLSDTRSRRPLSLFFRLLSAASWEQNVTYLLTLPQPAGPPSHFPPPPWCLLGYSCMKFPYWLVKLSFMVKLLSFSR